MSRPDRTYSTEEVAAIIERAAERQRRVHEPSATAGLTLGEVERACREAGLDPALVREAAAELDAGGLPLESGSAATSVAERWADVPFTTEGWEDAADQLRVRFGSTAATFGQGDSLQKVGSGWEWTHQSMSGLRRTVSVSPRGGRMRVRVVMTDAGLADERLQGIATGAFLGILPAMLLGALLAETLGLGDFVGVLAVGLVLLAAVVVGGLVVPPRLQKRRAKQAREARALAADVANWMAAAVPTASVGELPDALPTSAASGSPPSLALDESEPEGREPNHTGRRTRS